MKPPHHGLSEALSGPVLRTMPAKSDKFSKGDGSRAGGDVDHLLTRTELFARAAQLRDRIKIEPTLLDYLHRHNRDETPRTVWERHVRMAWALESVMHKYRQSLQLDGPDGLIDESAKQRVLERLNSGKPILLLNFHGGFVAIKQRFFTANTAADKLGLVLKNGPSKEDPGASLFAALRSLQNGQAILMAPDGPNGKQNASFAVLDKVMPGGDGAAYLATAAECNTAWYDCVVDGNRFRPQIVLGPKREQHERFEAFRDRLHAFYAEKIESVLTGDPRNLVLRPRWTRILVEG